MSPVGARLAEQPGERYATAGEFATALRLPQTVSSASRSRRKRRRWLAGSAVTVVALATVGAVVLPKLAASSLDPSLYIVVPFGHRGGAAPALVNGDQCELLLSEAFGRWTDVRLADPLEVHDARAQLGNETMTLDGAKELAKKLGAGMLVWGDVVDVGDSTQVTAALYDLRHGGKQLRDYSVRIHKDGRNLAAKFRKLADSICQGPNLQLMPVCASITVRLVIGWIPASLHRSNCRFRAIQTDHQLTGGHDEDLEMRSRL